MSFRCEKCRVAQPVGTRPTKVITEIREKSSSGSLGYETVTELCLCEACATVTEDVAVKLKRERRPDGDFQLTSTLAEVAGVA